MNARDLQSEFAHAGERTGETSAFDARTALEFVRRAQEAGLAISDVEMVRPTEFATAEPPQSRILRDAERISSWEQARSHIEMLAGRGLYFWVAIESPWSTRLARLRSLGRMIARDGTSHPTAGDRRP